MNPELLNNQRHKGRFVNNNQVTVTGAASSSDNISYVKGIDFNSQQKYDFNIVTNLPKASSI